MRLSMSQLVINSPRPNTFRTFERYHGKPVLIEWKEVGYLNFKALETRVDCVSTFLQELEASFHSLPCRGYVKDHDARRYGYVFDLPTTSDTNISPSTSELDVSDLPPFPTVCTLREILDLEAPAPSLNLRVSYAVRLLETLLQLHTSGWLHKELRSENILFIQNTSSISCENDHAVDDLSPSQMYLAGYVYTRADNAAEMTEPLESELEADLYRHPSTIGRHRLPFRKTFDMFSVGCILLELGLWATISTTLRRRSDRPSGNRGERRNDTDKQAKNTIPLAQKPMSPTRSADRDPSASISRSIDLVKVRSELLSSLSPKFHPKVLHNGDTGTSATTPMHKVFKALESAAGKTFADVVRELISAETLREGKSELSLPVNEHQDALALEMQSLNKLRSILDAI
jgi:serine/threonine protein kinase